MTASEPAAPGPDVPYDGEPAYADVHDAASYADVPYDAVVLAGGAARRLGGVDKPAVRVGGRPLLDRVLAACAGARATVVVAEPRPTARPVRWAREEPPGGGPVAALDAGLRRTTTEDASREEVPTEDAPQHTPVSAELTVVFSADLPFLDEATVRRLVTALRTTGAEGALLTDADGRDQPLVAAYRTAALRRELAALADGHGGLAGLPLRRLTGALDLTRVPDPLASFDCDTWDDIATARARIREHGHVLDEWISAVKDELGIDLDVDTGVLLDLARDAAHGVARPAAPLTTFLVGYAAAQGKGGPEAVAEAARKATALALRWEEENASPQPDPGPAAG